VFIRKNTKKHTGKDAGKRTKSAKPNTTKNAAKRAESPAKDADVVNFK
jgi:hypothetical protein